MPADTRMMRGSQADQSHVSSDIRSVAMDPDLLIMRSLASCTTVPAQTPRRLVWADRQDAHMAQQCTAVCSRRPAVSK